MTLISTACSWVNMFGGHKAAIFTQVGQFYFGRWVSFSSAVTQTCLVYAGSCTTSHSVRQRSVRRIVPIWKMCLHASFLLANKPIPYQLFPVVEK